MNIVLPSSAQSSQRRLSRRTLGDILRRAPKPEKRKGLDSFFQWTRESPSEHLRAMYSFLDVPFRYPFAEWDDDGCRTWFSDAKCKPGPYQAPTSDGIARVLVVGNWKMDNRLPNPQRPRQQPNKPKDCRSYSLPHYYAHRLGLERVPPATFSTLAALLLFRVGAVPLPDLGEGATGRFKAAADTIFAAVEAGQLRVKGAFGVGRVLEMLLRLQQAHTWIANGQMLPAPLSPAFAYALQHECANEDFREAFNKRCGWFLDNRRCSPSTKRAGIAEHPEAGKYLDEKAYAGSQVKLADEVFAHAESGYAEYWNAQVQEGNWFQYLAAAAKIGLVRKVGAVQQQESEHDEEHSKRPIAVWTLSFIQVRPNLRKLLPA